jgi:hypothetical protein
MGWDAREETTYFGKTEEKYFSRGDWTAQISLNRLANFDFARMRFLKPKGCRSAAISRGIEAICPTPSAREGPAVNPASPLGEEATAIVCAASPGGLVLLAAP